MSIKRHTDVLKKTGFDVSVKRNIVSATKESPTKRDLETAKKFMELAGFTQKQEFGKSHANINIAYQHPKDDTTGFINYNSDELFLNAGD